jgi:hypothetical protein
LPWNLAEGGSAVAFKASFKGFGLMARSRQQGRHAAPISKVVRSGCCS